MDRKPEDIRTRFIAEAVSGRSFIDVGGLYWTVHEKVSVARFFGATKVALLDLPPTTDAAWDKMRDRLASKNIIDCEFISGDVQTVNAPQFDVVHSSGVLYHVPNMLSFVQALRAMTKERCILSTTVMPTTIEVDGETLTTLDGSAVFLPGLEGKNRELFVKYWQRWGSEDITFADKAYGGYTNTSNFFPNWWFPTVGALRGIARCAGFDIIDEGPVEGMSPVAYALLLK